MILRSLCALALLVQAPDGFQVAQPGYAFRFPRDHGSHEGFRSEWWYLTGHLWTQEGRRFGYQVTFFRQALPPGSWRGTQAWRTDQVHLAHAALMDEGAGRFTHDERLNRAGLVADAATGHLAVFNEDWSLSLDGARGKASFSVQGRRLELELEALTPPVIFGEDGVSRKGAEPSAASHYVTFPRLRTTARLVSREGETLSLSGSSWLDHEWSSSQLGKGLVGWDWTGIQFRDGRHLMAYRLRRADGGQDSHSTLTEVDAQGRIQRRTTEFRMTASSTWPSPHGATAYPLPLTLEAWGRRWRLVPLLKDQELRTRLFTYWEGACRVLDEAGQEVGDAYVELTGYAHSLQGRF